MGNKRLCGLDGCGRVHYAHGLCQKHYMAAKATNNKRKCSVEGCGRGHYARGYCSIHYERLMDYGKLEIEYPKERLHLYHSQVSNAWHKMRDRCENPNIKSYHRYGGRGIKVCDEWHNLSNFVRDMGFPKKDDHLHRVDFDGDYCPENCVWINRIEHLKLHFPKGKQFARRTYKKKGHT